MINLCSGILITIATTLIGYNLNSKQNKALKFFESLKLFNSQCKSNLYYAKFDILTQINSTYDSEDFNIFLSRYNNYLTCNMQDMVTYTLASQAENKIISYYFENLGRSNKEGQIQLIEGFDKTLNEIISSKRELTKKYNGVAVKLSFLIGLAITIIII